MEYDPKYKELLGLGTGWAETLQTQALVNQEALNTNEIDEEEIEDMFDISHQIYEELTDITEELVQNYPGVVTPQDLRDQRANQINKQKMEEAGFKGFNPPEDDAIKAHNYCRNSGDSEIYLEPAKQKIQKSISDYEELVEIAIQDYDLDIEPLRNLPDTRDDAEIIK